jgi:phosphorylase kinase alpha/beta subunit
MASIKYPLLSCLKNGLSAAEAKQLLAQNDCLSFPQLRSGLFPAANFDHFERDETGLANAWLRDTACIGIILLNSGKNEIVAKTARGVLNKLHETKDSFENIIKTGAVPDDDKTRPPVRYTGQESVPRYDWANAQNDALGYSLQLIGLAAKNNIIKLSNADISIIKLLVDYLAAVSYWQDAESGHWEEIKKVNASSIGTVLGGLRQISSLVTDKNKVDMLIEKGTGALAAILPSESLTPGYERKVDAALIFLIEPQQVIKDNVAEQVILSAEQNLMGERGFRRYTGDSYWGPDYREHFLTNDRAGDFSEPKDMAHRDKYLFAGGEAQWTFFDPLVSAYYARRFQKSRKTEDATKAQIFMVRALKNIVEHQNTETGELVWRMPELFFLEKGEWVPNDHFGLLWAEANLLYGLSTYEEVFSDKIIKT